MLLPSPCRIEICGFMSQAPGFSEADFLVAGGGLDAVDQLPLGSTRYPTGEVFFECTVGHVGRGRQELFDGPCSPPPVAASREANGSPTLVGPASPGRSVGAPSKRSNLDATGLRVVRAGVTVSDDGFRYFVTRVRLGTFYGRWINAFGSLGAPVFGDCRSVRVVA